MLTNLRKPIRQGDVLLIPIYATPTSTQKLPHLTLAEGEVTGHSHRISSGEAELYERDGTLYLRILSPSAVLNHEEHHPLDIPQGSWMIRIQREYHPLKSRNPVASSSIDQGNFSRTTQPQLITQSQAINSDTTQSYHDPNVTSFTPEFIAALETESSYWDGYVGKLERQKEAFDKIRHQVEKKQSSASNKKIRAYSKYEIEERRQLNSLLPLIQDKQPIQEQEQPRIVRERRQEIVRKFLETEKNWRDVID